MHVLAVVLLGAVFAVGVFGGRWLDAPDYRELCEAECACTGCIVRDCVANYERLGEEQGECRGVGDAIATCKLQKGGARCDRGAGMSLYMPTEACRPQLDAFMTCLDERADARAAQRAEEVQAARKQVSYAEALHVMCDAPTTLDLEGVEPGQAAAKLAEYIEMNAANPQFEALMQRIANLPSDQRDDVMRNALRDAGIARCAFMDASAARASANSSGPD